MLSNGTINVLQLIELHLISPQRLEILFSSTRSVEENPRRDMTVLLWLCAGLSRFSTSSRRMSADPRGLYTLPTSTEVCALDCTAAFNALSDREKLYAHYLSRASWYGSLICLYQVTRVTPDDGVNVMMMFVRIEKNRQIVCKYFLLHNIFVRVVFCSSRKVSS